MGIEVVVSMSGTRCRKKNPVPSTWTEIFSWLIRCDWIPGMLVQFKQEWFLISGSLDICNLLLICLLDSFFFSWTRAQHFDAALTGSVECCLITFSCDASFQWCFTCAFFPSAHTPCSPPNFHCRSPPTCHFTSSCPSQILERFGLLLTFSLHLMEKKIDFLKKGIEFTERTWYFPGHFPLRGRLVPVSCTCHSKNVFSLFACGTPPPSHFPLLTDFPIRSSSLWVNKIILYSHIPREGKDCPSL